MDNLILTNDEIWDIADKAEKACNSTQSRDARQRSIENAIRTALMKQIFKLVTIVPATQAIVPQGVLNLTK